MQQVWAEYGSVVSAWVALGAVIVVQVIVSDVAAMRAGHVPGTPVGGGHGDFLFRASRAHANTNENLGLFVLASLAAIATGASPAWAGRLAWTFVVARVAHMGCYYADLRNPRSAAFTLGLVATIGLLVISIGALT